MNGLADVQGIGPKTLEKLAAAGIKTAEDLLHAKSASLAEKTGLSEKRIMAWQSSARSFAVSGSS